MYCLGSVTRYAFLFKEISVLSQTAQVKCDGVPGKHMMDYCIQSGRQRRRGVHDATDTFPGS